MPPYRLGGVRTAEVEGVAGGAWITIYVEERSTGAQSSGANGGYNEVVGGVHGVVETEMGES